MPDFHLGQNEAASLAAFLLSVEARPLPAIAGGDPKRGEALFKTAGCAKCHDRDKLAGQLVPAREDPKIAQGEIALANSQRTIGSRVAWRQMPRQRGKAPGFQP